jgi:hypothetical protein
MRCLVPAALLLLVASSLFADELLPSRTLSLPPAIVTGAEPASFDLVDWRAHARQPAAPRRDTEPHSMFVIKSHVGIAAGYDNGVLHGSAGFYLTVAEWGRWNFGVPSPALGFGRYPTYDERRKQAFTKDESTIIVSLASVHYRVGYIRALGVNWYINLEQIFDMRRNTTGSQAGLTVSRQ